MEKQFEILNQLAIIISDEANRDYDSVTYEGKINVEEGWLDSGFSFVRHGKKKSVALSEEGEDLLFGLVFDLHKEMNAHTGGNWKAFTLTIGEDGKAKTKFEYPEEEQANG
jgi:hypothetical protein